MENGQLLFKVSNRHAGNPPIFDGDDSNKYYGYFENEHGEQSVFVYDFMSKRGTIWSGDAGWDEPYEVVNGIAPGLVLIEDEAIWLMNCWQTAKTRAGE